MNADPDSRSYPFPRPSARVVKTVMRFSAVAGIAVYLLSGVYGVKPEQQALVTRCGKLLPLAVRPGTHYHLPYPIDRVYYLKPNEVKSVVIAATLLPSDDEPEGEALEFEGATGAYYGEPQDIGAEFLTGDENIIHIALTVQYRIGDPGQYVFRCPRPEKLVTCAAEMALTHTVAQTPVDDLLTSGRHLVLAEVKRQTQETLTDWKAGIEIISANFASVYPPAAVSDAFKGVASALEDRDRIINEARGDQNETVHRARGTAQKTISEAMAFREAKVNRAKGETDRFLAVLQEYCRTGKSTVSIARIYTEAMEEIMEGAKKYFISPPGSAGANARQKTEDAGPKP